MYCVRSSIELIVATGLEICTLELLEIVQQRIIINAALNHLDFHANDCPQFVSISDYTACDFPVDQPVINAV